MSEKREESCIVRERRANDLRIGIVGCGMIAELAHLPALEKLGIRSTLLIDRDLQRANALAERFGATGVADDWQSAASQVDAVIIATPNNLHEPIATSLLKQGVHVLVEKPMARTPAECDRMIAAAGESGATLMVGHRRRYMVASQWMAETISSGKLGTIETFDFREGYIFDWPVSRNFWDKQASGGGVLLDMGAHLLDQLLWWLGPIATVEYEDDACGGVESDCSLTLTMQSGARGRVELSRSRNLRNTAVIQGSKGKAEVALAGNWAESKAPGLPRFPLFLRQSGYADIPPMLRNWIKSIAGKERLLVTAREAGDTVGLINQCYQVRRPLRQPWLSVERQAL